MALQVEIFGRNMEVTDRLNDYVTKKVSKLDRYLNGIDEARVDLAYVKSARSASDRQVAQITVRGKGFILRSEERADDIFAALDTAMERMQRRIERYKGKHYRGRGDGRSAAEVVPEPIAIEEGEVEESIIARRKRFHGFEGRLGQQHHASAATVRFVVGLMVLSLAEVSEIYHMEGNDAPLNGASDYAF